MALYKHYPLRDADSIRLLTLHLDNQDADIKVSIGIARLSAKPSFIALSYTWGSPVDEQHPSYSQYDKLKYYISCDGERIAVGQNLYEALAQLREAQEQSPLWIDAICINQRNDEERNHQILLMPSIYHQSSWVVIWLGRSDEAIYSAIQTLNRLQDRILLASWSVSDNSATELISSISRQDRQALGMLFRRRWFNRVWTLQEVLLPTRARCICGWNEVDVEGLSMFAALLLKIAAGRSTITSMSEDFNSTTQLGSIACISAWFGSTLPAGGFGSRALLRYPKIDYQSEISRSLKWLVALELLVHESRQRSCTKLEDKVLAPLAFALHDAFVPGTPDFHLLANEARKLLNYDFSVLELYLKFTRFMTTSMANLDILSRVNPAILPNKSAHVLNLPSWVPSFNEAGTTSFIDDILFTQYNAAAYLGPYRKIHSRQTHSSELLVCAVFFGRIVQVSQHTAPVDTILAWLSHVRNSDQYKEEVRLSQRKDLVHTLVQRFGQRIDCGLRFEAKKQSMKEEYLRFHSSATSLIQLNTTVSQRAMRRLFRLDVCGQSIFGLGPVYAQESDHLCVLQGARIPFVVRETLDLHKYVLIGEALAENFMHGQVQTLNFADREVILV